MRYLAIPAIFLLAACADQAVLQMQQACQSGDMEACQTLEMKMQQQRMNALMLMGAGQQMQQQAQPPPPKVNPPVMCRWVGQTWTCF